MKEKLHKILNFLNLLDSSKRLSITNIAVIILLGKIAYSPTIDWQVVAGLLITLLSYSHKRIESNKFISKEMDNVSQLTDKIKEIQTKLGL